MAHWSIARRALVPVDYMSAMLEAEALQRRTGAPQAACIRLADFASKVRTVQAQNKSDSRPFSIRRLIAFANATHRDLMDVNEAWINHGVFALARKA